MVTRGRGGDVSDGELKALGDGRLRFREALQGTQGGDGPLRPTHRRSNTRRPTDMDGDGDSSDHADDDDNDAGDENRPPANKRARVAQGIPVFIFFHFSFWIR